MRLRYAALHSLVPAVAACQLLVPLAGDREVVDAGAADAPYAPTFSAVDPCAPLRSFAEPEIVGSDGQIEFDVAFSTLIYDRAGTDGKADTFCPDVGFNLDDRATCWLGGQYRDLKACPGGDVLACAFGSSCSNAISNKRLCDTDAGIDNAMGQLLSREELGKIPNVAPEVLDPSLLFRLGRGNLIMHIAGFNGQLDDKSVSVSFYISTGLVGTARPRPTAFELVDGGEPYDAGRGADEWDGVSLREWYIAEDSVDPTTNLSNLRAGTGFVSNGILVLHVQELLMPLGGFFAVQDVTVVGRLVKQRNGGFMLDHGRLGGYLDAKALADGLSSVPYRISSGGTGRLCDNPVQLQLVKQTICEYADSPERGDRCTRLSVGAAFLSVPVVRGPIRGTTPRYPPCDTQLECK